MNPSVTAIPKRVRAVGMAMGGVDVAVQFVPDPEQYHLLAVGSYASPVAR
ncbi:MAG: hypothetical protein PVSMB4_19390 [Ktedonobacterales bacterium]